jgi:multidrug efflux pump subunit AcrA (membrane-fusion protein)
MRLTKVRMILATVTALALMVGVGTAFAASGNGPTLKEQAAQIASRTSFDAAVASNLGTTTAKLNAAIKAAATARINAALAAGDITADEATTLKDALADGTIPPIRLATAATVAKELNTTEAKLNAAYASAQKAQAIARVDAALKAGQITEAYATELKTKINAQTFPGFGAGPGGGHHGHGGPGGPGFGLDFGFGPPADSGSSSSSSGSSSSSTTSSLVFA